MYIFHMVLLRVLFQPLFRNSIEIIHVYRVLHFYPVILKNLICILFYHIRSMGPCFLYLKVLCVCVFLIFCGWKAWIFAFNPFFQVWWWRRNCVTFSAHFHWLSAHVFSLLCLLFYLLLTSIRRGHSKFKLGVKRNFSFGKLNDFNETI